MTPGRYSHTMKALSAKPHACTIFFFFPFKQTTYEMETSVSQRSNRLHIMHVQVHSYPTAYIIWLAPRTRR
jgi:hypothetical protein